MGRAIITSAGVYLYSSDNDRTLALLNGNHDLSYTLSVRDVNNPSSLLDIFTSINKPSGSYIGDGSTARRLDLNVEGNVNGGVMLITCEENNTLVIVTPNGSFVCDSGGVTFEVAIESVSFSGRRIIIWKNTGAFNAAGNTYEYFVL